MFLFLSIMSAMLSCHCVCHSRLWCKIYSTKASSHTCLSEQCKWPPWTTTKRWLKYCSFKKINLTIKLLLLKVKSIYKLCFRSLAEYQGFKYKKNFKCIKLLIGVSYPQFSSSFHILPQGFNLCPFVLSCGGLWEVDLLWYELYRI